MKVVTSKKKNNKGFSLVELIVVIAIMAVLIGVLAPQFIGWVEKSKRATDLQNAQSLASEIAVKIADAEADGPAFAYTAGTYVELTSASTAVSKVPAVKLTSGQSFYWMVDANHIVHIAISASGTAPTATDPLAGAATDVYPIVNNTNYQ